ncbi:MAG: hypothetical protein CVV42_06805 [Candidatus Riflebacteria bacterium HGW-Riflebacteria-2]|jgi:hypothetical protein|nr:MAG: hypothetical protein CVV42_06805 [Candidatus Riflebacteria bacterium HGW-Riflebacteria-2]
MVVYTDKMRIIVAKGKRRGSVAVLVGGIILALLIFFGAFIKYSSSRQYATKRLNRILLAREFSAALASFACHHLKEKEIHNLSGKLVKCLEKPLSSMSGTITDKIVFTPAILQLVKKLEVANSELHEISWQVSWEVKKDDFKPITPAYPREKNGLVRIPIVVKYLAPASDEMITEEYLYTIKIKVVANLIPVLSKFTLYVKDARSGEDEERFNRIVNDEHGKLLDTAYAPWVLKNSGSSNFPASFGDIVKSARGLVYMGGGRINLGIARGWSDGPYGEGFHLLGEGRRDGFYKIGEIGPMSLLNCETGLCKTDYNNEDSVSWYDLIKSGYAEMAAKASIFKLFGSDQERSPTIVFGNTAARTICGKAFRESHENFGPLPYTYCDEQFENYQETGAEEADFSYFLNTYSDHNNGATLSRSQYNKEYASCLIEVPYNRALGYILTNYNTSWPLDSGRVSPSDPLHDFISGKAGENGLNEKIPSPFSGIYSDIQNLSDMKAILEKSQIFGGRAQASRSMTEIVLPRGEKLITLLQKRGYLADDKKLDLNGWLYVKAPEGKIVIDESLRLISHGGIVLEEGNIEIKNAIKADGGRFLLNLVAKNGNILVDSSVNGELAAGLTAAGDRSDAGQVKFAGGGSSSPLTVRGNVAMQRIAAGTVSGSCARGVNIVYAEDLAALPQQFSEAGSEQPLLMFSFEYPRLLD